MQPTIQIITPLYNDWQSLALLLENMGKVIPKKYLDTLFMTVINDGSSEEMPPEITKSAPFSFEVVHLSRNLGHQKAIAIGLARAAQTQNFESCIVMDADGEDQAKHISLLIEKASQSPEKIVFAQRTKRTESPLFKLFYKLYKLLFFLLIGKTITFGNFCLLPRKALRRLVYCSEIWNNFPGGIIRSKIPYTTLPLDRGTRFAGKSKMNFTNLILHGLGAISVHIDLASVRILITSFLLIVLSLFTMSIVVYIRLFTDIAYPGWATYLTIGLFGIVLQAFLISLFLVFIVLNHRTQRRFIPAADYQVYVYKTTTF